MEIRRTTYTDFAFIKDAEDINELENFLHVVSNEAFCSKSKWNVKSGIIILKTLKYQYFIHYIYLNVKYVAFEKKLTNERTSNML